MVLMRAVLGAGGGFLELGAERAKLIARGTCRLLTPCSSLCLHRYRAAEEMRAWRARDPVSRFQCWLVAQGWWEEGREVAARAAARREAIAALEAAQRLPKPPLHGMFEDVYDVPPPALEEQRREVTEHIARHPDACPADIPLG